MSRYSLLHRGHRRVLALAVLIPMIGVVLIPDGAQAAPGVRIDLKVLVIADTGLEPSLGTWTSALDREGVPYDVIRPSVDPTITAAKLATSSTRANYQGIVVTNQLAWASLAPEEKATVTTFEREFGIRQVTAYVFPSAEVGLNPPSFAGDVGGVAASMTSAGRTVFPYLAGPIEFEAGAFGYLATPLEAEFQTLVQGPGGAALVGVHTHPDGRQELVTTVDSNQFQVHGLLLTHGMLGWLTRGVYLGHYRQYLELQVDDVFYDNDRWDTVLNTTHEDDGATLPVIRMIPSDVDRALAWSATTGVSLDMVFNGFGSVDYLESQRAVSPVVLIDANFNGSNNFIYSDDAFRGTNHPTYASGTHLATGGFGGSGGLRVLLGGLNDDDIFGMSGGWRRQFTLSSSQSVAISFQYNLTHAANYEADEYSEALVSIDGQLFGLDGADYVDRIYGDGNGGTADSSGWILVEEELPVLSPGNHEIVIGVFNNLKTLRDENAEILIDDVRVVGATDPLTEKLVANASNLYWINHTYRHFDLNVVASPDPHDYAAIVGEINDNKAWAAASGIPINPSELVTGEHSGLARTVPIPIPENPELARALTDTGIEWIATDNSVDPTQYRVGSALTVPRHPANIFYNTATREEQLDEYNYIFFENCTGAGCIPAPVDWAGYLDNEATIMFRHVASNDPRPHYVHQSNLAEDGVLYDVVDEVLARTNQFFTTPLVHLTHTEIGKRLGAQQDWASLKGSGRVTAYRQDGNVHLVSTVDAAVPLTGAAGELYGGMRSDWINLSAGVPRVISISAVNTPPVAVDDGGPDGFTTPEDNSFTSADVTANDFDFEDGTPNRATVTVVGSTPAGLVNNNDGTFGYTPSPGFFGAVMFDYQAKDSAGATSNTATVTITVTPVNDQPTATNTTQTQIYIEGAASVPIDDIVVTDPDPGEIIRANLTLADPARGALTTSGGESYNPATGEWTITDTVPVVNTALAAVAFEPVAGNNIDTAVFVGIFDGGEDGVVGISGLVTLDVDAVNDPPTATNLDQNVPYPEDSVSVALGNIAVTDPDLGELVVANFNLSPTSTGSLTTSGAAAYDPTTGSWSILGTVAEVNAALASVAFEPVADNDVDSVILVAIEDGDEDGSGPLTGTITLDAIPINDAPSFTKGAGQVIAEDAGGQSVAAWATAIAAGPAAESGQTATFVVTENTNPALFSTQPAIDSAGILTYAPVLNANGVASITIELRDNGGTDNGGVDTSLPQAFTITVNPVNDAPTVVNPLADVIVAEDDPNTVIDLATVFGDVDIASNADALTYTVALNDASGFVAYTLVDSVLTLDYLADLNGGPAAFTVQATDTLGAVIDDSFTITVNPINDAPTVVNPLADLTVREDHPDTVIDLATVFGDVDIASNADALTYTVALNDASGFVTYSLVDSVLTLDYLADQSGGPATLTVQATDTLGAVIDDSFTITVNPVNDAPSFTHGQDHLVVDPGVYSQVWATEMSVGPANESHQSLGSLTVTGNSNPDLFSVQPTIDLATGVLAFKLADASGFATLSVTLTDTGGTAGGGVDATTATLTITSSIEPLVFSTASVGLVDVSQAMWYLRATTGAVTQFFFGNPGDMPIVGDWNGDGNATPGLFRRSDGFFYMRNSNTQGPANAGCFAGDPSDIALSGDWDGDGDDNLGIYRPGEQKFYLFTGTCAGSPMGGAQISLTFGNPGDAPVAGDWDGDGVDEIGLYRESTGFFYWRNTLDTGSASGEVFFGDPGDRFVVGDWGTVDGYDTPAVFRPGDATFYFRHTLTQGNADSHLAFGEGPFLPVAGSFGLG